MNSEILLPMRDGRVARTLRDGAILAALFAIASWRLTAYAMDLAREHAGEAWGVEWRRLDEPMTDKLARSMGEDASIVFDLWRLEDDGAPVVLFTSCEHPTRREIERVFRLRNEVASMVYPRRVTWALGTTAVAIERVDSLGAPFYAVELSPVAAPPLADGRSGKQGLKTIVTRPRYTLFHHPGRAP